MKLLEYTLPDLTVSGLTQKELDNDGANPVSLITAKFDGDDLFLLFEVTSLKADNSKVDLKGKFRHTEVGYSATVTFYNAKKYIKVWNKKALSKIIDNCDVKIYCDCPAFYWQGMAEDDVDTSKYKFQGTNGSHIWSQRHAASGNYTKGLQICKHLESVRCWLLVDNNKEKVVKKVGKLKESEDYLERIFDRRIFN